MEGKEYLLRLERHMQNNRWISTALLDDPAEAQKMGRRGNLRITRNFSHKAVTDQMMNFYKDAIDLESN